MSFRKAASSVNSRILIQGLVGIFGIAATTLIPLTALAASSESSVSACASGKIDQVYYSATFSAPVAAASKQLRSLRIRVGRRSNAMIPGEMQAEIVAGVGASAECQATCRLRNFETENTFTPIAMSLDCSSARFDALASQVTVFWPTHDGDAPAIRFGSWVSGYQEAKVAVEVDRWSEQLRSQHQLASAN